MRKKAKTAKVGIKVWQVPIIHQRDLENQIGVVTIDPQKLPEGSDWGLQPGVNKEGHIILFTTIAKKNQEASK